MQRLAFLTAVLIGVVACTTNDASPTATSEARLRDNNLPKIIVTLPNITPSPSMNSTSDVDSTNVAIEPTATENLDVTPTTTPTPYVGVFIGEPTVISPQGDNANSNQAFVPTTLPNAVPNNPAVANSGACAIPIAEPLSVGVSDTLGCPTSPAITTTLISQTFERGQMIWRDTRQIFVLANSNTFWRVNDGWNDGIPESDPALVPPAGLQQPIRGFGLAWRDNLTFQDALGWAQTGENPFNSTWQDFEGGIAFVGNNNQIIAIPTGSTGQYTIR